MTEGAIEKRPAEPAPIAIGEANVQHHEFVKAFETLFLALGVSASYGGLRVSCQERIGPDRAKPRVGVKPVVSIAGLRCYLANCGGLFRPPAR